MDNAEEPEDEPFHGEPRGPSYFRPPKWGDDDRAHTAVIMMLALIALGLCIWLFWQTFYGTDWR